jgi:shikimate kinase
LWQRSQADGIERPLRKDRDQFAQLYAERLPFYREATITVETEGKDATAICSEIESALGLIAVAATGPVDSLRSGASDSSTGETK